MIKLKVNNLGNYERCFQVMGTITQNGKEIKAKVFAFADDEDDAKNKFTSFKNSLIIKYNYQTLADAQRAYKKEFGIDVELDSDEFKKYIN